MKIFLVSMTSIFLFSKLKLLYSLLSLDLTPSAWASERRANTHWRQWYKSVERVLPSQRRPRAGETYVHIVFLVWAPGLARCHPPRRGQGVCALGRVPRPRHASHAILYFPLYTPISSNDLKWASLPIPTITTTKGEAQNPTIITTTVNDCISIIKRVAVRPSQCVLHPVY